MQYYLRSVGNMAPRFICRQTVARHVRIDNATILKLVRGLCAVVKWSLNKDVYILYNHDFHISSELGMTGDALHIL